MITQPHKTGMDRVCMPGDLITIEEGIICCNCHVMIKTKKLSFKYATFTRAHNIGGGWRYFQTVQASSPAHALELTFKERAWIKVDHLGTPEKPFITNGGASDFCVVLNGDRRSL